MSEIIKKFTSRKFLLALVGVVSGLALAMGVEGSEIENIVGTVGGIVTAVSSILVYINGEAKVDAAAAKRGDGDGESK
jgi:hypothetical protein